MENSLKKTTLIAALLLSLAGCTHADPDQTQAREDSKTARDFSQGGVPTRTPGRTAPAQLNSGATTSGTSTQDDTGALDLTSPGGTSGSTTPSSGAGSP